MFDVGSVLCVCFLPISFLCISLALFANKYRAKLFKQKAPSVPIEYKWIVVGERWAQRYVNIKIISQIILTLNLFTGQMSL